MKKIFIFILMILVSSVFVFSNCDFTDGESPNNKTPVLVQIDSKPHRVKYGTLPSGDKGILIPKVAKLILPKKTIVDTKNITMSQGVRLTSAAGYENEIYHTNYMCLLTVIDCTSQDISSIETDFSLMIGYDPNKITELNQKRISAAKVYFDPLREEDVNIYFFDKSLHKWVKMNGTFHKEFHAISVASNKLGIYAVGIQSKAVQNIRNFQSTRHNIKLKGKRRDYNDNCRVCTGELDGGTSGCNYCSDIAAWVDEHAMDELFKMPCALHDCCYRHGPKTYGFNKHDCDDRFYGDMCKACNDEYAPYISTVREVTYNVCSTVCDWIGLDEVCDEICETVTDIITSLDPNPANLYCLTIAGLFYQGVHQTSNADKAYADDQNNAGYCEDYLQWGNIDCYDPQHCTDPRPCVPGTCVRCSNGHCN